MKFTIPFFIFMFSGVLISFSTAFGFEIVRDGKAKCVIVIPEQAIDSVVNAAQELQYHVEKSTGVTLNITSESSKPETPHNCLYLGTCTATEKAGITTKDLSRNGCIIKTVKNDLFIVGRDMPGPPQWNAEERRVFLESGTKMGVYHFLDKELGVRWLWPGKLGEVIPCRNTLEINNFNLIFTPPLRSSHIETLFRYSLTGWSGEPARGKFSEDEQIWESRHGFSYDLTTRAGGAFPDYWERFHTSHPEFFNQLPDGSRRPDPYHVCGGKGLYVSMCVSEPGLWRQIIEDWKINRQKNSGASIELAENDTAGCCVCPKCLSWDVRDPKIGDAWDNRVKNATRDFKARKGSWTSNLGSLSDRYARFYLEVQNLARQTDPEVTVTGFVYANYVAAPRTIKLNSKIILSYVGELMFPWTDENVCDFKETWQGWSDTGAAMVLRPNFMLDGHCMPIFFARKFHDLFRFCFNHGMLGADLSANIGQYATQGPNMYVMARMVQAPDMSCDEILDEFYSGFGPAKTPVKEYFEFWESVSDSPNTLAAYEKVKVRAASDQGWERAGGWDCFFMLAPYIFSEEIMNRGRAILERAEAKAKGDPVCSARVDFLRKGFKNAELTLEVQRIADSGDKYKLAEAVEKLDRYRASIETDNVANMSYLAQKEDAVWDRTSLKFISQPSGGALPLPDTWKFMWDPEEKGTSGNWFTEQFDDSQWYKIGIDTCWENQIVGKDWKKQTGTGYDGIGWYRNLFELKQPEPGKKFKSVLTFGAVDEACEIWVNGHHVLSRPYPYEGNRESWQEPFECDITDVIRFDRPNILTVRVEDRLGAGGIWRPVWVSVTESAAGNLLPNGGFENANQSWNTSNMNGGTRKEFIYDESQVHNGRLSGLLECLEIVETGVNVFQKAWSRWYQFVKVEPGKYRFRVWVRTEPDYQGEFLVHVLASDADKSFRAKGTGGTWKEVVLTDITTRSEQLDIYLNLLGAVGKVWFDDAELIKE